MWHYAAKWSLAVGSVLKDPPAAAPSVPGILGMNVIQRCYRELFGVHDRSLFELPAVAQAPGPVIEALHKCHLASDQSLKNSTSTVRVHGTYTVRISVLNIFLVRACYLSQLSLACRLGCCPMSCPGSPRYSLYCSGQCRDHRSSPLSSY